MTILEQLQEIRSSLSLECPEVRVERTAYGLRVTKKINTREDLPLVTMNDTDQILADIAASL